MTVANELSRKTYAGDGVTTSHGTSPMVFFAAADLDVYVVTTATGAVVATLTLNTHYTVSGGSGSTGTVNLAGGSSPYGAIPAGRTLVVVRDLAITQSSDLVNNDFSDAEVVEDALDRLTMIAQELNTRLDRSFVLADTDVSGASTVIPTPSATALIGWNGAGTALQNYTTSTLSAALTTAFTLTLLDDADADAFFQTLIDGATAETTPAVGDLILISDVSLTPDDGRKMTLENVLKVVGSLTEQSSPEGAEDYVLIYDADATAARKTLLQDAVNGAYRSMQVFTASGTWTKPAGLKRVKVTLVGGGGGGAGSGTTPGAATAGGTTSFGAHVSCTGGALGQAGGTGISSAGGTASSGDINLAGAVGAGTSTNPNNAGGSGGASPFGGAGANHTTATVSGVAAAANTGSGGSGAGCSATASAGGGGGAGGYAIKTIAAASLGATETVTVGAGGTGGTAGGSGAAGGNGGSGIVIVEEFF